MAVSLDTSVVQKNLSELKSKFEVAVELLCENGSQKMERYAKEHRPWKDRTSNARQRLKGSWERTGEGYVVKIAHGVNYGVWLEFAHERKYAILLPTIEKVGKGEILPAFKNFMERLKK